MHDSTIEVTRIQAHSELVILLRNHKTVYPSSGLCTFLNDSQLLHSLKLLFKKLRKGHRNPMGRVHNRGGIGINLNFVLDVCILGFQVFFLKVVNSLYLA